MTERPPFYRRRWAWLLWAVLLLLAAVSGTALGYFMRLDLPDVRALEDYNPPVMTRVLAADGSLVGSFAEERRILVNHGEIPQVFREALIAVEDANFDRHTGIDFRGILRAAWRDLRTFSLAEGASTLTQQLARNLFLNPDKTLRRKLQEVLLAMEIERQYSKQEIMRFYCNQIYTGHGRYGIEAASRFYFGKPARELTLTEAATLAGLIQRPEALSPFKHPQRALDRRNVVLRRMFEVGALTEAEAAVAQSQPLDVASRRKAPNIAPYFVEEVRRWLQARYGSTSLYKEGLEVRTTLDPQLQEFANHAMDLGLRELDKRQGWRGMSERMPPGEDLEVWEPESWSDSLRPGEVHDGLVQAVDAKTALVRVGPYRGVLGPKDVAWTGEQKPDRLMDPGDLIRVRLLEANDGDGTARLSLEQDPLVEGALIALEPSTGAIKALVGGFDFERSEFNRAIQAKRQTGSAFKPFVYAAALASGWTLADTLLDEPTVFLDRRRAEPYQPENYTNKYYETITLRTALEKSANVATVKLLDKIGYDAVIETARRLGIRSDLQPFPSLALGSFETSLLELTSAYGTFANQGVQVEPHLVVEVDNRDGAPVERTEPRVRDAVPPQIAYLMNRVLLGVVTDGTGRAAASLGHQLAGKTGTTDNNTDAWFIGYSPDLAVGVWVGFDEPRSLGSRETGALAALPSWRAFMELALAGQPPREFPQPPDISIVALDRATGLKSNRAANCDHVFSEVFLTGTEPTDYCSHVHHQWLALPYKFHRFEINENGALRIPAFELDRLLQSELEVYLIDGGQRIEYRGAKGTFSMPLQIVPDQERLELPARLGERYDLSEWLGRDGRGARIIWLN